MEVNFSLIIASRRSYIYALIVGISPRVYPKQVWTAKRLVFP